MKGSPFQVKLALLYSLMFMVSVNGYAQKISRSSINPFGLTTTHGRVTLQQTAGQPCDYNSLQTSVGALHQGFIQGIKTSSAQAGHPISCNLIPNPGTGLFALHFSQNTEEPLSMRIFKISGELISSFTIPRQVTQYSFELNSGSAGVYFIRLEGSDTKPMSKKLILTR